MTVSLNIEKKTSSSKEFGKELMFMRINIDLTISKGFVKFQSPQ